jgi:SAM-dependent methyltransferase
MNLSNFQSLLTDEGQRALESAMALRPKETDFLRHFTALERRFPREIARAALEIVILRGKATVKFPADAHKLFFTREALEQASSAEVATYRARRFETFELVCDLGCSAGGDTFALTARAPMTENCRTVGIDRDPLRLAMAAENVRALGLNNRAFFVMADLTSPLPLGRRDGVAVFFDPGRREGESRLRSVRDYQPPLGVIQNWLPHWGDLGVKISPAVRTVELAGYDAEVEFISLGGELKEAVLWFGSLRRGWASRRATVLPGCHTMTGVPDLDGEEPPIAPRLSEPRAYLYEPDAAVIRAGLVRTLGAELDATQLDADIAFLTSDRLIETPFAEALAVEDWLPFNVKRLRAYLRDRNVGSVTVKKRGSPVDTEKLARDLKRRGQEHRLVVLTQLDDKPIVIICR